VSNNNPINDNTGVGAGPATGGSFQVELVVGTSATTVSTPITSSINPMNQGYFNGPGSSGIIALDGTAADGGAAVQTTAGGTIFYQVEAWSGAATYAAALTTVGDLHGISAVNSYSTGGSGTPPAPPGLLNFATFNMSITTATTPEPTTLALGAMGIGAALLFRRRK